MAWGVKAFRIACDVMVKVIKSLYKRMPKINANFLR